MGCLRGLVLRQPQFPNCCKVNHDFWIGPISHLPCWILGVWYTYNTPLPPKQSFPIPRGLHTNNPEISQKGMIGHDNEHFCNAFLMFLNVFHWPHLVDDFGLLKWFISTFLAQDMRLTLLKITQFGWQI